MPESSNQNTTNPNGQKQNTPSPANNPHSDSLQNDLSEQERKVTGRSDAPRPEGDQPDKA